MKMSNEKTKFTSYHINAKRKSIRLFGSCNITALSSLAAVAELTKLNKKLNNGRSLISNVTLTNMSRHMTVFFGRESIDPLYLHTIPIVPGALASADGTRKHEWRKKEGLKEACQARRVALRVGG